MEPAARQHARSILSRAFSNLYDVDTLSNIELIIRDKSGQERRRSFEAASKVIDNRIHSIGRLVWPNYLRGMTIMTIENSDRSHDAFVYLPSLKKVRRITTAQRGDAFFGTDVTYEDLERRRAEEYDLISAQPAIVDGETVLSIEAKPRRRYSYARVTFSVSEADAALLESRYYKRHASEPYRIVSAPRSGMKRAAGHILPTRMLVHNLARGTTTEVRIQDLRINPRIDEKLFSVSTLEQQRPLPRIDAPGSNGE